MFCLVRRLGIDPVMLSHPRFFLFLVGIGIGVGAGVGVAEGVVATSKVTLALVSITASGRTTASALGEGDIS